MEPLGRTIATHQRRALDFMLDAPAQKRTARERDVSE